jgi:arabinose-5-phosphate isomerase
LKNTEEIIALAKETLIIEAKAVEKLADFIDESFAEIIQVIFNSKGRLIVSGIGKSAIIANKIVATLNSTGTPSIFLHAADAIHGDLGIIQSQDIVICISKSGNTPEIKALVPLIKNLGNKVIALVGNLDSFLALQSDYVLNATVDKEACPNNLAPTTSTTAQLALGDALAVCLLACKGFSSKDFATYHPGGSLGKMLYLKVEDLIVKSGKPMVKENASLKEVIIEISSKRLGATAVVDEKEMVVGIITDGDLRRMIEKDKFFPEIIATEIMSKSPKSIISSELAINAMKIMKENSITQLIVKNETGQYEGVLHLHELIKEGLI